MNSNFANNLKKLRKDNNLSQEELALELGVSRQSVSKWESGQTYPEMDKVLQLCKMFNVNIDDIIDTFVVNRKNKSLPSYYDVYFEVKGYKGDITINEPLKCSELVWANIDDLPNDMIDFEIEAINNNKKGIKFSTIYIDNEKRV